MTGRRQDGLCRHTGYQADGPLGWRRSGAGGVWGIGSIEAAGWQVIMPEQHICCGRPLYDYGFLDAAERCLHRVLDMGSAGLHQVGRGPPPHTAYRLMTPWWPGLTSGAG